jgi:hypothetical protein
MEEREDPQQPPAELVHLRPAVDLVMPRCERVRSFVEKFPSVQTTRGSISSILRWRKGLHASISSGCGSRLPGGRDWRTFAMKTASRDIPISSSSLVSS